MVSGRTYEYNHNLGKCLFLYWEVFGAYESTEHVPKLNRATNLQFRDGHIISSVLLLSSMTLPV